MKILHTAELEDEMASLDDEFTSLIERIESLEEPEPGDDDDSFDAYQTARVSSGEELATWLGVHPTDHLEFIGSIDHLLQDSYQLLKSWSRPGSPGLKLNQLTALKDEVGWGTSPIALIHEDSFIDRAREVASESRALGNHLNSWPCNHIDWESAADQLKADYSSVNFCGATFYYQP